MKQTAWLQITKAVNKMEKSQHFLSNNNRDAVPAWERLHYLFHMGVTGELLVSYSTSQPALQSFNYGVMSVWQAWSEARQE